MDLFDTITLEDGSTRRTADGYLVADVKVARTGIQLYSGKEVGRPELTSVRVYRPEAEVFSEDAMRSFAWRPVTINHPKEPVSAANWSRLAVGQVGDTVTKDGEFIRVPMMLMDAAAIRAVEGGKRQLSMGYSAELVWGDGVSPQGERYDAIQKAIRGNHLAVVDEARGGPALTIGTDEANRQETPMNDAVTRPVMQTVMVDGLPIQTTDVGASIVTKAIEGFKANLDKLQKRVDEEEEKAKAASKAKDAAEAKIAADAVTHKTALDAKDAELAVLKKQLADATLTPAQLDAAAKDRVDTIDAAKRIVGSGLAVDGKSTGDIKAEAVKKALGDAAKDFTADQVAVAFTALTASGGGGRSDPIRDSVRSGGGFRSAADGEAEKMKALDEANKARSNAWMGNTSAAQH